MKSPVTMNRNQLSGAIFLPLRMRSNLMPLLIVNTHLACNALDCSCLLVFSLLEFPLIAVSMFLTPFHRQV
jgi:hypothetical protein